jgi:hypothetical protein
MTDSCPICNEVIRLQFNDSTEGDKHAALHGMSLEELWLKKHNQSPTLCQCGCGEQTKWVNWWSGYSTFRIGHNGNIYTSYATEVAQSIAQKRRESLTGRESWAKGLTKETDERIKIRGEHTSAGLKRSIEAGTLVRYNRFTDDKIVEVLQQNNVLRLESIGNYKNCLSESITVRCVKCNEQSVVSLAFARNDRCKSCDPVGSKAQLQIADWIESIIGVDVGRNVRGVIHKRELDIYIPSHQLAIELNGIYWHNESRRDNKYHQGKTNACRAVGIKLMHIFDDEWDHKQDIVKSMICARLNAITNKVMARKCSIKQLDYKERIAFFATNHLDGDTLASAAWGLIYEGEIVAALSVRTPFHKLHKDAIEIARSANKLNTIVPGGTSRLMTCAIEYAKSSGKKRLLSYVDERLGGDGTAYQQAGFSLISSTMPRFWWTNGQQRFNRFKFKADSSRGMTEQQVADEAGVVKIWGCGNQLYELAL